MLPVLSVHVRGRGGLSAGAARLTVVVQEGVLLFEARVETACASAGAGSISRGACTAAPRSAGATAAVEIPLTVMG